MPDDIFRHSGRIWDTQPTLGNNNNFQGYSVQSAYDPRSRTIEGRKQIKAEQAAQSRALTNQTSQQEFLFSALMGTDASNAAQFKNSPLGQLMFGLGGQSGGQFGQPGSPDGAPAGFPDFSSYGDGRRQQIETAYADAEENALAALSDRGFLGSDLNYSTQQNVQRKKAADLAAVDDSVFDRQLDFFQGQQQVQLQQQQLASQHQARQQQLLQSLLGSFNFSFGV